MGFDLAIQDAYRDADAMVTRFRAMSAGQDMGRFSSGGIAIDPLGSVSGLWGRNEMAEEQMARFRGWVFACIRPIAQTIAGLEIKVGRREKAPARGRGVRRDALPDHLKGMSGGIELYERHRLLDVLSEPNPVMTDWHLKYVTAASLELTGMCHWWLSTNDEKPVIWPIPASWISPVHDERPFARWRITPGGNSDPVEVDGEEVVYFYYPDPSNPLGCKSPTQATSRAITADESIQEAQARSFANGIWPGLAIIAGDITDEEGENAGRPLLEKEQRDQIHAMIRRHYAGVMQMKEALILDALIKDVKQISNKPAEMDFMESASLTKERISQAYGTNPAVMGEIEGLNRASSAVSKEHFADFTVNPKVVMMSQVLTKCLAPRMAERNESLVVYIEPYRPHDSEERRKDWDMAAKYGCVKKDEVRQHVLGLAPLENGDGEAFAAQETKPTQDASQEEKRVKSADDEQQEREIERRKAFWLKRHGEGEARLAKWVESFLLDVRKEVAAKLEKQDPSKHDAESLADAVFDAKEWDERMRAGIRPELYRMMLEGAVDEYKEVSSKAAPRPEDLLVDLPPEVAEAINGELDTIMGRPYWQEMPEATRRALVEAFKEGMAANEGLYELAVRIGVAPTVAGEFAGVLGDASNTARAMLIARTETTGAFNAGHYAAQKQLAMDGLITGKQWLAIVDNACRPTHAQAHLQIKRVTQPFVVGGNRAPYPGHHSLPAGERCSCRCTTISTFAPIRD